MLLPNALRKDYAFTLRFQCSNNLLSSATTNTLGRNKNICYILRSSLLVPDILCFACLTHEHESSVPTQTLNLIRYAFQTSQQDW